MNKVAYRARKVRPYGSAAAVVTEAIEDCGGAKRAAHHLQRSLSQTHAYADPNGAHQMTVEQAILLSRFSSAFAEQLAAAAGGLFQPIEPPNVALHTLVGAMTEHAANVVKQTIEAIHDGDFSPSEARRVGPSLDALCRSCGQFRALVRQIAEGGQ